MGVRQPLADTHPGVRGMLMMAIKPGHDGSIAGKHSALILISA
jgi:hypothetical protein